MNILLTGGLGYIGSHTALELISVGARVVLLDDESRSTSGALKRLENIARATIPHYRARIQDTQAIHRILEVEEITHVVHLAAYKSSPESIQEPLAYYENNVGGTISLLCAMSSAGVDLVVFSSSAAVYGPPTALPISETHTTDPQSPYAYTKLASERIISDWTLASKTRKATILRYFNPAGAHPSGLIGDSPLQRPFGLFPALCLTGIGAIPALDIFGTDYPTEDGTPIRDFIHIADLAAGHVAALRTVETQNSPVLCLNLGTGKGTTVLQAIRMFEQCNGIKVPHNLRPRRPGDIAISYADPSMAHSTLAWRAEHSLQDMCISSWIHAKSLRNLL